MSSDTNIYEANLSFPGVSDFDYEDLTESYQYVDDDENIKAKIWSKGEQERIYFRIRRHDDSRKFREICVELPVLAQKWECGFCGHVFRSRLEEPRCPDCGQANWQCYKDDVKVKKLEEDEGEDQ